MENIQHELMPNKMYKPYLDNPLDSENEEFEPVEVEENRMEDQIELQFEKLLTLHNPMYPVMGHVNLLQEIPNTTKTCLQCALEEHRLHYLSVVQNA